ncbi:hypothetical protein ATCC90586_006634 [Pythium insidiosum]|nr:hypothetical protein ATCC90586_006634 [Pythium insidiosum]
MEPKSGKLFKVSGGARFVLLYEALPYDDAARCVQLGHGLFGPKWTEKWVHLDGQTLKYFAMAAETQPFFSLSSARQSRTIDLLSYAFSLCDDVGEMPMSMSLHVAA